MLGVIKSLDFLKVNGLPVVKSFLVRDFNSLGEACKSLSYPLVLKIDSSVHKSDVGGVVLGVKSFEEAVSAFDKLRVHGGVVVQEQLSGVELILGVKFDPVFGQVLMFGLGGVLTEVFRDVSFRVCPVSKADAYDMIGDLRGKVLLSGYRGSPVVDVDLLASLIVDLSKVAVSNDVIELDVNPLIVSSRGFFIVDARVMLK